MQTILFVLHNFFNHAGTEQHTKDLFEGLNDSFNTYLLFPSANKLLLTNDAKTFTEFPAALPRWPVSAMEETLTDHSLSQALEIVNPDIIHLQHFYNWPLSVLKLITKYPAKTVISYHDYYALTPHYTMQNTAKDTDLLSEQYSSSLFGHDISNYLKVRRQYLLNFLPEFDLQITPSIFLKDILQSHLPLEFTVVPHGIKSFNAYSSPPKGAALRFGYVGSLLPQKGWHVLLKAFIALNKRYPETTLEFFGGGNKIDGFRHPQIRFHGIYEQGELPYIFSNIDIAIIPSLFPETFCLTLSEAWMASKPVAASNIGALQERITDNVNGRLFPPDDVDALYHTLAWFVNDSSWQTWDKPKPRTQLSMIDNYKEIYQSLYLPGETPSKLHHKTLTPTTK